MAILIGDPVATMPAHGHAAGEINAGTFAMARIPDLASMFTIEDSGLLAAVDLPSAARDVGTPTSGQVRCCRIRVPNAIGPVTGLSMFTVTAPSSLSAAYGGLYNAAGTSLLASSANRSGSWVTGYNQLPFSSQLASLAAGDYILAFTLTASTMPQVSCANSNSAIPNIGRAATAAAARSFGANTSTTLPASLTFSAVNALYWMGLY